MRLLGVRYWKMPLLGLPGFPPFALELHAFYRLLMALLGGHAVFGGVHAGPLTTS